MTPFLFRLSILCCLILATGVPVLAQNQGLYIEPKRNNSKAVNPFDNDNKIFVEQLILTDNIFY